MALRLSEQASAAATDSALAWLRGVVTQFY
jgi:hypothetical protein